MCFILLDIHRSCGVELLVLVHLLVVSVVIGDTVTKHRLELREPGVISKFVDEDCAGVFDANEDINVVEHLTYSDSVWLGALGNYVKCRAKNQLLKFMGDLKELESFSESRILDEE